MKEKIKLFDPSIGKQEQKFLNDVLKSRNWASGSGEGKVSEFEKKFQQYVKACNCVAVNSGTAALHLAVSASNVEKKTVILPSLSFVSTAHSVVYNNGSPLFVDIDPKTLCIDIEEIEKRISKNTKVILPVHFGGMPTNMKDLKKISRDNKTILIEDAAHACGSSFEGKRIGSHGDFVCFSFHPVKNLSMPTGGLIAINSPNHQKLKKILMAKRWCGITDRNDAFYDVKEIGWNYYMNNFSAAIGLTQLEKIEKLNNKRKIVAKKYFKKISLDSKMPYSDECSYHLYWILVKNRNDFRKKMLASGIETGIHYKPIHKMSMYRKNLKLPNTEIVGNQIVSIPMHANLSEDNVEKIIESVNKFSR